MAQKKRPDEILPVEKLLYWLMSMEEDEIEPILAKIVFSSNIESYKDHSAGLFDLIYSGENIKQYKTWHYQKTLYDDFKSVGEWKNCPLVQRIQSMPDNDFIYTFDWFVHAALREWILYNGKLTDTLFLDLLKIPYDKKLVEYFSNDPPNINFEPKYKFM